MTRWPPYVGQVWTHDVNGRKATIVSISETDDTVTMSVEVVRKRDKPITTTTFYQLASKWTPTEGKVPYSVRKEMLDHDPNRA